MSSPASVETIALADGPAKIKSPLERLMAKKLWDEDTSMLWLFGVQTWQQVMLSPEARPYGSQIDFFEEQLEVTEGMFKLALFILSEVNGFHRDEILENKVLEDAYGRFFPDEYYVGVHQLDEVYQRLIIDPARLVSDYQISTGKVGTHTEAIA